MQCKAVLFDLDGTLADSAADLAYSLNCLLAEEGRRAQEQGAIRSIASHGARALIKLGFGLKPEHPSFEPLRLRFLEHYAAHCSEKICLFDGVVELLTALEQHAIRWGIVTNKPQRFTEQIVSHLPFPSPPAVVVSGDSTAASKPEGLPMRYALDKLGLSADVCWYVGDAQRDIQAGHAVNIRTALARWGYFSATDKPEEWGADAYLDHPLDLLALTGIRGQGSGIRSGYHASRDDFF